MRRNKGAIVFWLVFGLLIAEESWRLKLGTFRKPDSGLFPFLIGLLIATFSVIALAQGRSKEPEKEQERDKLNYRNMVLCILSLYAYALLFEWLGFIPSTFLLIVFFLKFIEQKGWILVITASSLASVVSYAFFELWLRAALPKGIFGI